MDGNMRFACGFYSEFADAEKVGAPVSFGFLDNLRVTSESSAYSFLHGCCDEFAAILSDIYGYEIECVRNADERLIHAYCISYIGDQKAYIDVRGITTDPVWFFKEFENELTYYPPEDTILVENEDGYEVESKREVWATKDDLFDGEYEHWDDPEIEAFIKDYADYYDTDRYLSLYKCKTCGQELEVEDPDWFDAYGEEDLWGHIQLDHPALYEECQNWETPDMLEIYYDHVIEKRGIEMERLDSGKDKVVNERRSLDAIISDAKDTLYSRKGPDDSGPGAPGAPANEMELPKKLPDAISR